MTDLRPTLEAIAAGQPPRRKDADVLVQSDLDRHAKDFVAWAEFANNQGREPLAAPTALLSPLP